jgi:glycosyltransferase involved in cell wall biosynthesis
VLAGSGDPAFVTHLQQEGVRLGIGSDILWAGFLSGEEKWNALADADLFVLPSYSENFGVAVVEAMAWGLPVVVSDHVGIHKEVIEAQAGLVVPCDIEKLTQAFIRLLSDTQLRALIARNGQSLARKHFSIEAVTERLIELYTELTNPHMRAVAP